MLEKSRLPSGRGARAGHRRGCELCRLPSLLEESPLQTGLVRVRSLRQTVLRPQEAGAERGGSASSPTSQFRAPSPSPPAFAGVKGGGGSTLTTPSYLRWPGLVTGSRGHLPLGKHGHLRGGTTFPALRMRNRSTGTSGDPVVAAGPDQTPARGTGMRFYQSRRIQRRKLQGPGPWLQDRRAREGTCGRSHSKSVGKPGRELRIPDSKLTSSSDSKMWVSWGLPQPGAEARSQKPGLVPSAAAARDPGSLKSHPLRAGEPRAEPLDWEALEGRNACLCTRDLEWLPAHSRSNERAMRE